MGVLATCCASDARAASAYAVCGSVVGVVVAAIGVVGAFVGFVPALAGGWDSQLAKACGIGAISRPCAV